MNTTPLLLSSAWCILFFGTPSNSVAQNNTNATTILQNWQFYHNQGEYDKAIEQAKLIYQLGKNTQNEETMALALNWEGQSLLKKTKRAAANRKAAKKVLQESLERSATLDNKALHLDNLQRLRDLAEAENDTRSYAIYHKQIETIEHQITANESNRLLSEKVAQLDGTLQMLGSEKAQLQNKVASLSAAQMRAELLLAMQKNHLDSLKIVRMQDSFRLETKELALKEQTMQLELQQSQIALQQNHLRLQSSQRNFFIAVAAILSLLAIGSYIRSSEIKKYNIILNTKNEALLAEQQRSEALLLNILPRVIAEELKVNGNTKARRYEQATVMFTDFKDFSRIAQQLSPEQLVSELDTYFCAFDKIIHKYRIEKIKTIGDAYMCVGGLPDVEGSEPKDVVLAALEIQDLLDAFKLEREQQNRPYFEARIGIHTGPLVAGVVGSMKFAYDIWGDTVNVAARLESKGLPRRVNISAATYELVKDYFACETRGIISVKNNHDIAMYFVNAQLQAA